MSDFGTEMGNRSLLLAEKFIDALLQLMNKVYENAKERKRADDKLGKIGFVNHYDLEKAGVPLVVVEVSMKEEVFRELISRCKREELLITGIEDRRARELSGIKSMIVKSKQSDLPKLASLIDLINEEKRIAVINKEITAIQGKGSQLTKEDALVIGELERQIRQIQYGHSDNLNKEQARGICEQAVDGQTVKGVTFEAAIDRWTGGKIDIGTECYIVDARNPDRYIVCNSQNDIFRNTEYVKTSYQVYNGGKLAYSTNDGRFEGRTKDYWRTEKAAMREAGSFTDLIIKFYSVKEMELYREHYKAQNATELDDLRVGGEGRDYDTMIKKLESQAGQKKILNEGASQVDIAMTAEFTIINKQITNYNQISKLESEVAIARTHVLTADQGTPEYAVAQNEFNRVDHHYRAALQTETSLMEERKGVNAVQVQQEIRSTLIEQRAQRDDIQPQQHGNGHHQDHGTMVGYKGEINKIKQERLPGADLKAHGAVMQSRVMGG